MTHTLGISTCPNDTFAFHAILNRKIDLLGLDFDIRLLDVQELNEQLAAGKLDYSKASFHAALHLAADYGIMRTGSAIGFGVGPVLLARPETQSITQDARTMCPGAWTTATLLMRVLHPEVTNVTQRPFFDIIPAVQNGDTDLGVCIHEGRFVYKEAGLICLEDLGDTWEKQTGSPLPLGGILGRHSIDAETHNKFNQVLQSSIDYACRHPEETMQTMRQYAQEISDEVIQSHVDLYVNDYTKNLGETGSEALETLATLAKQNNIIDQEIDLKIY